MATESPVLTVTQLNRHVKGYLENEIGIIHVEGEISNFTKPSSGHIYFTLKDSEAQIRCVFFKNRHFSLTSIKIGDGTHVVASGRLSLYEARGDYQLIVEHLTDAGLGILYQRFEELKNKLSAEGLFHPGRKKPLPVMPQTIGIITSTTGAAIKDILATLARRFPLAQIFIYPSEVQGVNAPQQLIKALKFAHAHNRCEVLILARGGGSIEDLWAFNDELLAREIAGSTIPIVSGVGHETDFTIADFVADYRAETPTAAAAAVSPNSIELHSILNNLIVRLQKSVLGVTQNYRLKLNYLIHKISSPEQTIAAYWQTVDYLERRLLASMFHLVNKKKHQFNLHYTRLHAANPKVQIEQTQIRLHQLTQQLSQYINVKLSHLKYHLHTNLSTLHAVSPLATLDRGYAIASKKSNVLFNTQNLEIGDNIDVRLANGNLACEVTQIKD